MKPIERLELANQQTWWLPSNVVIHQGTDHCFYCHDGMFRIVRFTPPKSKIKTRLQEILNVVGKEPVRFTYLPHRHSLHVLTALNQAGFVRTQRCEGRVIHVDHVTRPSPPDIQVIMVHTFAQMKRIYTIRKEVFGDRQIESDENIRRYLNASIGPKARVRQFLALDKATGAPLSQAGMSLFPNLKFSFLFAGGTLEEARGRGAYTALIHTRVNYARSIGMEYVGLFAREDTSAPIVTQHGFDYCGEMEDWGLRVI